MAIFGAPVAHEDDAERAVRAGLGMQDAMAEVNAGLPAGAHFALRVGVNTGEVLAGAVGDAYTVIGDTVNVASRLQTAARPGSVTVGERTMRATDAAVEYTALEPLELKGKAEPRARLGGGRADRRALGAAGGARRASRRSWAARQELDALDSLYERVVREGTLAPGDGRGRGRRGQVAAPARVRAAAGVASLDAHGPHRPLPAVRERHRVLGARRGAARRVRDRGVGLVRGGVAEAPRLRRPT